MLVRVLLAEDHTLVRAGIRALLQSLAGVEVIGEAPDGYAALEFIEKSPPDLVLMDIAMQRLNGLEATARIKDQFPQVRVIILSMHANEEYVTQALRSGAMGYLLKGATPTELEQAIRTVMGGEVYLTPSVSKHVIEDYIRRVSGDSTPLDRLSARQREILQLIAEGRSTHEIALLLKISTKTVETHRAQLMERLNIHDIAGLVRYAIRMGLVSLE